MAARTNQRTNPETDDPFSPTYKTPTHPTKGGDIVGRDLQRPAVVADTKRRKDAAKAAKDRQAKIDQLKKDNPDLADNAAAQAVDSGIYQPAAVTKLLRRPVTANDLPNLANAWNALQPDKSKRVDDPKKILGVLSMALANNDINAQYAIQTSGSQQTEYSLQLGAHMGGRKISIPVDRAEQLSADYTTEVTHLPILAGVAETSGLGQENLPLLLAAMHGGRGRPDSAIGKSQEATAAFGLATGTEVGPVSEQASSFSGVAQQLKQNLDLYHDPTMALIATEDPNLAAKMISPDAATKLTSQDRAQLNGILSRAGWNEKTMQTYGVDYDPVKLRFIAGLSSGDMSGTGAGGTTVHLPDPAEVRIGLDTLFRAWFQRKPTDEELSNFAETVNRNVTAEQLKGTPAASGGITNPLNPGYVAPTAATGGTTTDYTPNTQAQEQAALQATPEYKYLFGKMPGNMDPTQYVQQRTQEATQAFGQQGQEEPGAIRAGMASGEYGTTAGYLAGTAEAQHNSTFQGRLARMAQVVASMT